jgi:hypothetical protein
MWSNIRPATTKAAGAVCAVAIDAEEDFDWLSPVYGTGYSTGCMKNIRVLRDIFAAYGVVPTYLLTYPILEDAEVVSILSRQINRGECDVGIQLHPWVTPPFDDADKAASSFAGNLDPAREELKVAELARKFTECFGRPPRIYRAGRYGLGEHTAGILERHGFTIDTSVAPHTNFTAEGGPDYSGYAYRPFWFGEHTGMLELPLCRSIVGWSGRLAPAIYRALSAPTFVSLRILTLLTRSRCAERITLSPEGNDLAAMIRLVNRLCASGHQIFTLSFHSSSLAIGRNPYVQTRAELHAFYDRLSGILDFMATHQSMRFASLAEIPALMQEPAPPQAPVR